MAKEKIKPIEPAFKEPEVNRRNVNLNGGKEIILDDLTHNPSNDSIPVAGIKRSFQENSEIATSWLK
jgi:hypothetical protein